MSAPLNIRVYSGNTVCTCAVIDVVSVNTLLKYNREHACTRVDVHIAQSRASRRRACKAHAPPTCHMHNAAQSGGYLIALGQPGLIVCRWLSYHPKLTRTARQADGERLADGDDQNSEEPHHGQETEEEGATFLAI